MKDMTWLWQTVSKTLHILGKNRIYDSLGFECLFSYIISSFSHSSIDQMSKSLIPLTHTHIFL